MRKNIFQIHKWCGLILGGWLVLQVLSGMTLLYKKELTGLLYPDEAWHTSPVSGQEILNAAHEAFPLYQVKRVTYPLQHGVPYSVTLSQPGSDQELKAIYSRKDEKFKLLMGLELLPDVLFSFHDNVFKQDGGRKIVSVLACVVIFWSLSGIYLWMPSRKKRPLSIKWEGPLRVTLYDIHRVVGVLLSFFLIVSSLSALLIIYRGAAVDMFAIDEAQKKIIPHHISHCEIKSGDFIGCLEHNVPNLGIKDIRFDELGKIATIFFYEPDLMRPNAVTKLQISLANRKILSWDEAKSEGPGLATMNWMYPVHTGQFLGAAGPWVMTVFSLGLLLIITCGIGLWVHKKYFTKKRKQS